MAVTVISSPPIVFGLLDPLPLEGFPEGHKKIRMSNDSFVIVQVKTAERVRAFTVRSIEGKWHPAFETEPPPYGASAAAQIKALRLLLNRYRVLLFGQNYQQENIETIRALASHDDPDPSDAFGLVSLVQTLPQTHEPVFTYADAFMNPADEFPMNSDGMLVDDDGSPF